MSCTAGGVGCPKGLVGKIDHHNALTGGDLRDFVNLKLFPYLHGFKAKAAGPNTIEYKIGEIFGEISNKIQSGYNLREVVEVIDTLRFRSQKEKPELSHLYEAKIKNMGNPGRNGGDYYAPCPLIDAEIKSPTPKMGACCVATVAAGRSNGFLPGYKTSVASAPATSARAKTTWVLFTSDASGFCCASSCGTASTHF